jgi:predicted DNA-binding WGR domain protein
MITLHRIDPAKNMARFYVLDVQPTLFGEWSLVRPWGRINRTGRSVIEPHPSPEEASIACEKVQTAKIRRGYRCASRRYTL